MLSRIPRFHRIKILTTIRINCLFLDRKIVESYIKIEILITILILEDKRSLGRPKRTEEEKLKIDLDEVHVTKDLTSDKSS